MDLAYRAVLDAGWKQTVSNIIDRCEELKDVSSATNALEGGDANGAPDLEAGAGEEMRALVKAAQSTTQQVPVLLNRFVSRTCV